MSGRLEQSRVWLGLALTLTLLPGLFLSACDDSVPMTDLEPTVEVAAQEVDGFIQILDPAFIITGCWRAVGSSGGEFRFVQVAPNAFTFGDSTRTKLVVNGAGSFEEVNYDDEKPFFPPKYVHSVGQISADGNSISRKLNTELQSVTYRRCEQVFVQPLPVYGDLASDSEKLTPVPIALVTPLVLPNATGPKSPVTVSSPKPSAKPAVFLPPVPTPSPTPTPRPTPTPLPVVTPLGLPPTTASPEVEPTSELITNPSGATL